MLIVGSGWGAGKHFTCILPFDGPIGNPREAIRLLVDRKRLFPEWIETIILLQDERVLRHWNKDLGDWT